MSTQIGRIAAAFGFILVATAQVPTQQGMERDMNTQTRTRSVEADSPLLSPAQRRLIYQALALPEGRVPAVHDEARGESAPTALLRDDIQPVDMPLAFRSNERVPAEFDLREFPASVVTAVPAARHYRYSRIENRVLVIDPATRTVVDELPD